MSSLQHRIDEMDTSVTETYTEDRVWIELDRPRNAEHASAVCEKANNMLRRLGVEDRQFSWSQTRNVYRLMGTAGYTDLLDRGFWFNLDYLGR